MSASRLEAALLEAQEAAPLMEWEMDILRDVLTRRTGTPDQRNTLIRIIDQNKARKPVLPRILKAIGEPIKSRTSYTTVEAQDRNDVPPPWADPFAPTAARLGRAARPI